VLIRDATIHTMAAAGTLEHTDLLINDGKIETIGHGVSAPPGTEVIDARPSLRQREFQSFSTRWMTCRRASTASARRWRTPLA
jgi:hypothetical protein